MEPNDSLLQPPQKRPRDASGQEKEKESSPSLSPARIVPSRLPEWLFIKCEFDLLLVISHLDVLDKEEILGEEKEVEGAKWYLRFRRQMNYKERTISISSCLICQPESTSWRADCTIDFSIETSTETFYRKFEGERHWTRNGIRTSLRPYTNGAKLKAKVTIKRVNSRFLSLPVFDDPLETGHDMIVIDGRVLYVQKEILAVHSRVLEELFYAQPNGPVVFPYKLSVVDVICVLRTIYPHNIVVDDRNISGIAMTAYALEIWRTVSEYQAHLVSVDCKLPLLEKFNIAVECAMLPLLQLYKAEFTPKIILKTAMEEGDKLRLGTKTKAALFDLMMEQQKGEN